MNISESSNYIMSEKNSKLELIDFKTCLKLGIPRFIEILCIFKLLLLLPVTIYLVD